MAPRKPPSFRSSLLGKLLREHREAAGFKLADAGAYIQRDQSTMSRLESGHQPIRVPDMQALLRFYGITDERIWNGLEALSRDLTSKDWWDDYADVLNPLFVDFPWVEEHSRHIKEFEILLPHGLLQTRDYAAAAMTAIASGDRALIARAVEYRMRRQAILERKRPPKLSIVLDESVLLRPVGGSKVMHAQLMHLADLMDRPNIDLRVLPLSAGAHAGLSGQFQIFEMPDLLTEVVMSDTLTGVIYVEANSVARYRRAYDDLYKLALAPEQSKQSIVNAAKGLR
jgi:transcriptional regulator with XRE-family HTH domain